MVRLSILSALLCGSLVYGKAIRVDDEVLRERAANGLGKTLEARYAAPQRTCGNVGNAILNANTIRALPTTGDCHFPETACVQYTCTDSLGDAGGVQVCGHGTSDGASITIQCSVIYNAAQNIAQNCQTSASNSGGAFLIFVDGQSNFAQSGSSTLGGFSVQVGNFGTGGCQSPKY